MSHQSLHQMSVVQAGVRALGRAKGGPYAVMPVGTLMSALLKHGGLHTMLDADLMSARVAAFSDVRPPAGSPDPGGRPPARRPQPTPSDQQLAAALQASATAMFYKLVDQPGYVIHSELMAYISEPGKGNGVAYDEGVQPSDTVPAAFTFIGQFIDHDLTMNALDLTVNEQGMTVTDGSSPVIDLDSVYGPRPVPNTLPTESAVEFFHHIFDEAGRFKHRQFDCGGGRSGYDVPREQNPADPTNFIAYVYDNRNDENQLILQIHILVQRLHNKLIDTGVFVRGSGTNADGSAVPPTETLLDFITRVRAEVVATWQSFVRNDYMRKVIDPTTLDYVFAQVAMVPACPDYDPTQMYGALKHKPYLDLVTGQRVVRLPHEFAIGFRFGHSQLRPFYVVNADYVVLLFKDARSSWDVKIDGQPPRTVSGRDDLRGGRCLTCDHVIDWDFFYPTNFADPANGDVRSSKIDHLVTARVFNLPESAIPDDVKYIGNLPHRNLLRSTQIGIVSGEELADFYGLPKLAPADVLSRDPNAAQTDAESLFRLDRTDRTLPAVPPIPPHPGVDPCDQPGPPPPTPPFKTPLWYYILVEAEVKASGGTLGPVGGRLVAEVLAGALYYGNQFPYRDSWRSKVFPPSTAAGLPANTVTLRDIIDYVNA